MMACIKNVPEKEREEPIKLYKDSTKNSTSKSYSVNIHEPLDKKTTRPEILAQLEALEQEIIAKAKARGLI